MVRLHLILTIFRSAYVFALLCCRDCGGTAIYCNIHSALHIDINLPTNNEPTRSMFATINVKRNAINHRDYTHLMCLFV